MYPMIAQDVGPPSTAAEKEVDWSNGQGNNTWTLSRL